ncbi:phosphotransferase enzyme family protein [Chitinophaga pinensis]|uniref:Aminoglycoside phosphotransferase n=1 Tax=Chitinophaga pinensis (strain ATCC 43595 / DSM 2588 / LMG 13176 / NBRC 15968 / NCIMB 11800 / UQM 2034) TaxID=485918 RepID=A0A979GBI7_CHIPD|nr:aminoglycoside phosphotransferase family protein [Chitinophaga pinensis]ACU64406.1 aminoglycoside phosphotransferase [Chitinophaga pinensis DSM 2588]
MQDILAAYGLSMAECLIQPFGSGLINATWKISAGDRHYILQRINHGVFKQPTLIAENISTIGRHLDTYHPAYFFVQPVRTIDGQDMYITTEGAYFRMQPFVADSRSYDVVDNAQLAFEAARQFGRFTKLLSDIDINTIQYPLPDFHNLTLRYQQFEQAIKQGNQARIAEAATDIDMIRSYQHLTATFKAIQQHPGFKMRVMHHDTKISNVLFDNADNGICVIDLDTVMPGYFISDFGDMMRTYLSPVSEEETDFSKVQVRTDYYQAIVQGYLSEMKDELSGAEKAHLVYAGQFLVYMQAIRFLTDYFNNDSYYGAKYERHNLLRARNQLTLLNNITQQAQTLSLVAAD